MRTIIVAVVCLVIGLMLGRFLPSEDGPVDNAASSVRGGDSSRKGSRLASRDRSGSRNSSDSDQAAAGMRSTDATTEADQVTVPIALISELSQGSSTRAQGLELFSRDGKLEKLLNITDHEKAVIQKAWNQSLQQIKQLEAKESKSEDLEDGSVKITVPSLAGDMKQLGEDFETVVQDSLGENRAGAFLAMKHVDRVFTPTDAERTYQVSVESVGDGRWRYHMTAVDGAGKRRVWVGESVPDEIRHLTDAARILPKMTQSEGESDCE